MIKTFNKVKSKLFGTHPRTFTTTLVLFFVLFFLFPEFFSSGMTYDSNVSIEGETIKTEKKVPIVLPLDKVLYDKLLNQIANNPPPKEPTTKIVKDPETGAETIVTVPPPPAPANLWPPNAVYPNTGALLPFNRIIAYYGNLYSTKMGALGQYAEDEMLRRLGEEVKKWNDADPNIPALPALHYIAVVAQASAGADGKYRARMPDSEIDKVLKMAEKINAIVFLDIQVGFSTLQLEVPRLEKYLKLPNVHLGVDPEFSMKTGIRPGKIVGTLDASDINFSAEYLAKLVKENNLPPKVLVIHRYTQKMVTNYQLMEPLPEVQIVMHMDGWGGKDKKRGTYREFIYKEPVQFAGFKIFYKHDVSEPGTTHFSPTEMLNLRPIPLYIQYQ